MCRLRSVNVREVKPTSQAVRISSGSCAAISTFLPVRFLRVQFATVSTVRSVRVHDVAYVDVRGLVIDDNIKQDRGVGEQSVVKVETDVGSAADTLAVAPGRRGTPAGAANGVDCGRVPRKAWRLAR